MKYKVLYKKWRILKVNAKWSMKESGAKNFMATRERNQFF